METPDINIKAEPDDSNSLLSTPHLQDRNKKQGPIATIEISSDEDDIATPTPNAPSLKFEVLNF